MRLDSVRELQRGLHTLHHATCSSLSATIPTKDTVYSGAAENDISAFASRGPLSDIFLQPYRGIYYPQGPTVRCAHYRCS